MDTSWIRKIPRDFIYSLDVVDVPIGDDYFSELATLVGLNELKLMNCGLTSAIARDLGKLKDLKSLMLSKLPSIGDDLLETVAGLPNLQDFVLHQGNMTDAGMALLARSHSISCVKVYSVAITDVGVASLTQLPNLVALNIYAPEPEFRNQGSHTTVTDVGLGYIGRCPQLKSLNICGASVTADALRRLFEQCPNLRYLGLSRNAVDVGALEAAIKLKLLERIRITDMLLDNALAIKLSSLKNLRRIEGQLQVGNGGVEHLASLAYLESLHLSGEADDKCVTAIAKLRYLKELYIQNTGVTDDGLTLLRGLPMLEIVTLNGPSFTTRCVETAASWPNLKSLTLQWLRSRNDGEPEWNEIRDLAPTVRSLRVALCPQINDDHMDSISTIANLESLEIQANGLGGITDKGVCSLAQASQLKSLSIDKTFITDEGLACLRTLECLESLDLECMASSVGLERIGSLKRLNSLTISSPDLSERDVEDFKTRYPHQFQIQFRTPSFSRAKSKDKQDSILRRGSGIARTALNALEGDIAPALVATSWTRSDGEFKLDDFKGKVVLIDFWGVWCGECLQKMPQMRELQAKYKEKGLVVIGIHSSADSEKFDSFLQNNPLPWGNCIDEKSQTARAYSVDSWPSIYLVDREGKLRIANPVFVQLEKAIQSLLDE